MDTLIQRIELPTSQAFNEAILEEDEEILEPIQHHESDKSDAEPIKSDDDPNESDNESITDINSDEDPELVTALENAYLSPPLTDDEDSPCGFHVQYPVDLPAMEDDCPFGILPRNDPIKDQLRDLHREAQLERFADFYIEKIISPYHRAFIAGRRVKDPKIHKWNLPPLPELN